MVDFDQLQIQLDGLMDGFHARSMDLFGDKVRDSRDARGAQFVIPWPSSSEFFAATDEENYHRYMKYLKGCQYYFIDECIDVSLVTYLKPGAVAA